MGKNPAFQFYPMDWVRDLGEQDLEVVGAWIMIICKLWWSETRGKESMSLDRWAKYLRVDNDKTQELIDIISSEHLGTVTVANKKITIENRRMYADFKEKELNRLRQQKYRVSHKDNEKITPLSSSSSSSSPSESIIGKSLKVKKQTNPENKYKIQAIMDSLDKYYHVKPGGGESAKILKTAGDIGYALTSIQKSLSWGDENYLPKILRELKNRGSWPDSFHEQAKAENRKFEEFMSQKFGDKIGDMIAKIGRNVK